MVRFTSVLFCALLANLAFGQGVSKRDLKSMTEKVSYAIGVRTAQSLTRQKINLDVKILIAGMEHVLKGSKDILMTDGEIESVLQKLRKKHQAERKKEMQELGEKNKKAGDEFLAANSKKDGVITLKSGLQYKVLVKGSGRIPKKSDTVVTHYVGTLIDGQEFDSSRRRGSPATFPVSGVISGWTEALQLMPIGSKWMLYIPSNLAYGARGSGGKIGPNATLIFEIELLNIK